MFKREKRVSSLMFKDIFARGKKQFSPHFRVHGLPTEHFHCSVVVQKKVYKKSPLRNRYKRKILVQLREIFSHEPQAAFVFFLHKDISELTLEELHKELSMLVHKIERQLL